MTAIEKAAAIEYVLNLPVEIATINAGFSFGYYREYWVEGAKMKNIERDRNQFWYEKKNNRCFGSLGCFELVLRCFLLVRR